jgi:ELWxxDGT repeat protein
MTPWHRRRVLVIVLLVAAASSSAEASPRDRPILPTGEEASRSGPVPAAEGEVFFFSADDGIHGLEPWRSDGTADGTFLVRDIAAMGDDSYPFGFTEMDGIVYFKAENRTYGRELWRTDGTQAGTFMVKDLVPGMKSSLPSTLMEFAGELYFAASDGSHGHELWRSDGTDGGTVLVKEIRRGTEGSFPDLLAESEGTLFFSAFDRAHGRELWKTDGTEATTVLIRDILPGPGSGLELLSSTLADAEEVPGTLFFTADDGVHGTELWMSDGTEGGTVLVKDIRTGEGSSYPDDMTEVAGSLLFTAHARPADSLWRSDGSAASTTPVKNLHDTEELTQVGNTLFFVHHSDAHGGIASANLWKSDGTRPGTVMVRENLTMTSYSADVNLTDAAGTLLLGVNDWPHQVELWKSDGSSTGTSILTTIHEGRSTGLNWLALLGTTAFFRGPGQQLWRSDGTIAGTWLVMDVKA